MTDLTLYAIEGELLDLLELRDEVAGEVMVTESAQREQAVQLATVDQLIADTKKHALAKVDGYVALIREAETRAQIFGAEVARNQAKQDMWNRRAKDLKAFAAEAMSQGISHDLLVDAKQGSVIKRLRGRTGQLRLVKNPPSVSEPDMSLLPEDLKTMTITMTAENWDELNADYDIESYGIHVVSTTPNKREIAERLKRGEAVPGAHLVNDATHCRIS